MSSINRKGLYFWRGRSRRPVTSPRLRIWRKGVAVPCIPQSIRVAETPHAKPLFLFSAFQLGYSRAVTIHDLDHCGPVTLSDVPRCVGYPPARNQGGRRFVT